MPEPKSRKAHMREELRRRRRDLNASTQLTAARAVTDHIIQLPDWPAARRIALYLSNDGEIDTVPLIDLCRHTDKQVFLPVIEGRDRLTFAEWVDGAELLENRFGIPEPEPGAQRCNASELDIIIVPLVAWDKAGGRLGMGGGFYDRALRDVKDTVLLGLAHALQEVPRIPCDDWDVPLDFVVTDVFLHQCRRYD